MTAVSGKEYRYSLSEYPVWEYELSYEFLDDSPYRVSAFKTLMGFFLTMRGSYDTFNFKDPDDFLAIGSPLGTGDGSTTDFTFVRSLYGFLEPVGLVDTDNSVSVMIDGAVVASGDYEVSGNTLAFDVAPAEGELITATFQFFYVCRFKEDLLEFEKFANRLWDLNSCKIRSILT
jgi:uncharacterized protein (TIGR02217 family)